MLSNILSSHDMVVANRSTAVHERLRDWIIAGEFHPGQQLRPDRLSERLNASSTPIREALFRLYAEGMVEKKGRSFCAPTIHTQLIDDRLKHLRIILHCCYDIGKSQEIIVSGRAPAFSGPICADRACTLFEENMCDMMHQRMGDYWADQVRLLCAQTRCIRRIDFESAETQERFWSVIAPDQAQQHISPGPFLAAIDQLLMRVYLLVREFNMRAIDRNAS